MAAKRKRRRESALLAWKRRSDTTWKSTAKLTGFDQGYLQRVAGGDFLPSPAAAAELEEALGERWLAVDMLLGPEYRKRRGSPK